jgi:hypothetical protein
MQGHRWSRTTYQNLNSGSLLWNGLPCGEGERDNISSCVGSHPVTPTHETTVRERLVVAETIESKSTHAHGSRLHSPILLLLHRGKHWSVGIRVHLTRHTLMSSPHMGGGAAPSCQEMCGLPGATS